MASETSLPPPLPAVPPPLPPLKKKTSPWVLTAIIAAALVVLIAFVAIPAAILIPTVGKVRETARRTVDASNLRQVAQASLIYASEQDGRLPGRRLAPDGGAASDRQLATIHLVAVALARHGGLNDASLWFSVGDHASTQVPASVITGPIVHDDGRLNSEFMQQPAVAWDFVTGITLQHSSLTPVAWTRGLRRDGRWDPDAGVYGADGGHIVFLGGDVHFYHDLTDAPLVTPDGRPTRDILAALPSGTRVVGAGPGTLHGAEGGAP